MEFMIIALVWWLMLPLARKFFVNYMKGANDPVMDDFVAFFWPISLTVAVAFLVITWPLRWGQERP